MLYQDENLRKYGGKVFINDIGFLCGNSLNNPNVLTLIVCFILDRNTGLTTCLLVKLNA